MSCTCDIPFEDCPHAMIFPNRDKWYCDKPKFKSMKITIESTSKIVHLNGIPTRVWEGHSGSGIKVHCYIARVAIDKDEPRSEEFEKELLETAPPSAEILALPSRMVL